MRETGDKRLNSISNFLITGFSASAARAAVNPYSVVKIIAEVGAPGSKTGLTGGFYWLVRSQGWSVLGKGLAPAIVRAFPHYGIQFAVFNAITSNPNFPEMKKRYLPISVDATMPYVPIYFAGGVAGSLATLVTHPLDVVKVRMVAVPLKNQAYKGIADGLTKIMAQEGVFNGLYRGILPSLVGAFVFSGAMFTFWDIGDHLPQRTAPGGKPFVPFEWFLVPCGALIAASVASHPFDLIRRKVMAQSAFLPKNGGVDVRFTNLIQCVSNIYKYWGVSGFLFGVVANVTKVVPQLAVFWVTSKSLQYVLAGGSKSKSASMANVQ